MGRELEMHVTIKSPEDQEKMRVAGRLAAEVLDMIGPHVQPGEHRRARRICHDHIVNVQKAIPANVAIAVFRDHLLVVNHVVCHGIPNDKRMKNGDVLNIDVTVIKDGFHGDTSRMYSVGKVAPHALRLNEICHEAIGAGSKPCTRFASRGYRACDPELRRVREFLGRARVLRPRHRSHLSRGSAVLHYGEPDTGLELKPA